MRIVFTIEVEVERESGLFESWDTLAETIGDELCGADPGQVEGVNGGLYNTTSWDVGWEH